MRRIFRRIGELLKRLWAAILRLFRLDPPPPIPPKSDPPDDPPPDDGDPPPSDGQQLMVNFRKNSLDEQRRVYSPHMHALSALNDISRAAQDGMAFVWTAAEVEVLTGAKLIYTVVSKDLQTPIHWKSFAVSTSSNEIKIKFYEGPTITDLGTLKTPAKNLNRLSSRVTTAEIYDTPEANVTDNGEQIFEILLQSGGESGNLVQSERAEIILDPTKQYMFQIENNDIGTVTVGANSSWWENDYGDSLGEG